jgi:membrane-associated phospholipid phosphatase
MVGAGVACLAASILIGLAVRRRGIWLDDAMLAVVKPFVSRHGVLVRALSGEACWPHGAYLTALLPVTVTVVALAREARQRGVAATIDRWRWVLLTLAAIPVHYASRVVFARPSPGEVSGQTGLIGAYPSGTALAVGLGWGLCVVVVGQLRPRWRPWPAMLAVIALSLHAAVRVVTHKHWATDILGSYLLVAGAFLLAGAARPNDRRSELDRSFSDAR